MASRETQALEVAQRDGRRLRVTFEWRGDRFTHHFDVLEGGQVHRCLVAIEGQDDEPWPASPALQQLSVEATTPAGGVALLIGMAGRSHWSLSVERESQSASLLFDVAARVQSLPRCLGSRYQACLPGAVAASQQVSFAIGAAVGPLYLRAVSAGQPAPDLVLDGDQVAVAFDDLTIARYPTTLRWKYRVGLGVGE